MGLNPGECLYSRRGEWIVWAERQPNSNGGEIIKYLPETREDCFNVIDCRKCMLSIDPSNSDGYCLGDNLA